MTYDNREPLHVLEQTHFIFCLHFTTNEHTANRQISLGWGVHYFGPKNPMYKHIILVKQGSTLWTENPIYKHIMPVRLGCSLRWTKTPQKSILCQLGRVVHYFGPKNPAKLQLYRTIWASKLEKLQLKNANTEEDNNNGAEQPLTIQVRLERRPEKNLP